MALLAFLKLALSLGIAAGDTRGPVATSWAWEGVIRGAA